MLKGQWRLISRVERIGDIAIVTAMFFLTYYARDSLLLLLEEEFHNVAAFSVPVPALGGIERYFVVLGLAVPLFSIFLSLLGAYRSMRFTTVGAIARMIVGASGSVFLCLGFFLYFIKLDLSRSFLGIFCGLSGAALLVERFFVLSLLRFFRARGKNFRNILIGGVGQQAVKIYRQIVDHPELGIRVLGFLDLRESRPSVQRLAYANGGIAPDEVPGSIEAGLPGRIVCYAYDFEPNLKRLAVDEVLFTDVLQHVTVVQQLATIAAEEGVRVSLAADFFSLELLRSEINYFGPIPLLHFQQASIDSTALAAKRLIDIVLSAFLLVILLPFFLLIAMAVRAETAGPTFFRQRRVGLNGRTFTLLKFRSMVANAEALRSQLQAQNEMSGPVFKLRSDPRVTAVGRVLRRYSLDELPQLLNVLRGDMSLVGPRPPLPDEVNLYERRQRRRLSMRPGLTCTWQVTGRNDIPDFDSWAKLDLEYIDTWSLGNDLKLLWKTIPAVLRGAGAR